MVTHTERIVGRRQIAALIKSDPVDVILYRKTKVADGAGGWKYGPPAAVNGGVPQRVTLIPFKRRMTEFLVNTELGPVPDLPYVLIGPHDMDIDQGDTFTYNGDNFEVQTIDIQNRDVFTAAQVDYFGGAVNG